MAKFVLIVALGVLTLFGATLASPPASRNMFDSSSEESAETREMMQEIREMCRNNSGSDEAYVALMESMQTTMMCAMSAIELEQFLIDIDVLSNETRSTFFPRYCPQLRTAGSCLGNLLKTAKPCLEEEDFVIVKALTGIYPDAVELICKNDGDLLFKLEEPKYKECIDKLSVDIMECFIPFASETDNWDISHLTQDQCSTLAGLRQCIKGKMDLCKTPDLINVYDLFHNTLFRMTPCRNYVPVPKVAMIDNNSINEV